MMKKYVFLVVMFSLVCSGTVFASPYISGSLGSVITNDSDVTDTDLAATGFYNAQLSADTGFLTSIAVGNSFDGLRVEGEFAYRQADLDQLTFEDATTYFWADLNGDYTSMTLMANVYYDFMKDKMFSPFIGGGIGVNMIDIDLGTIGGVDLGSNDDTVLAYQLSAGVSFKVSEKLNLDFTYRYLSGDDLEIDTSTIEYASSNISLGARFNF